MSWSVYGVVSDGDTSVLEETWNSNSLDKNSSMEEQFEFALTVIGEAFDADVVSGDYSVSLSGHSNPDQENDRKSLSMSFSPVFGSPTPADDETPVEGSE